MSGHLSWPRLAVASNRALSDPTTSNVPSPHSRRSFLRSSAALALIGGGAGAALLGSPATARAAIGPRRFYDEFRSIRRHENNHVEFLQGGLGPDARPKPTFQGLEQPDYATFVTVSQALEQTGVGAYLGATMYVNSPDILGAAAAIALIEGQHSGFLNVLQEDPITGAMPDSLSEDVMELGTSFAYGLTPADVGQAAGPFIANLNGGPPIDYAQTKSNTNDVAILNFALALEYLEAEFYNINVPKFFET